MSKVTSKYQITIPVPVRKKLKIIPGSEVDIVSRGSEFVLRVNPIEDLKRAWKGRFRDSKTSDQYMSEIRDSLK